MLHALPYQNLLACVPARKDTTMTMTGTTRATLTMPQYAAVICTTIIYVKYILILYYIFQIVWNHIFTYPCFNKIVLNISQ